jgi:hypothetical protein
MFRNRILFFGIKHVMRFIPLVLQWILPPPSKFLEQALAIGSPPGHSLMFIVLWLP